MTHRLRTCYYVTFRILGVYEAQNKSVLQNFSAYSHKHQVPVKTLVKGKVALSLLLQTVISCTSGPISGHDIPHAEHALKVPCHFRPALSMLNLLQMLSLVQIPPSTLPPFPFPWSKITFSMDSIGERNKGSTLKLFLKIKINEKTQFGVRNP